MRHSGIPHPPGSPPPHPGGSGGLVPGSVTVTGGNVGVCASALGIVTGARWAARRLAQANSRALLTYSALFHCVVPTMHARQRCRGRQYLASNMYAIVICIELPVLSSRETYKRAEEWAGAYEDLYSS